MPRCGAVRTRAWCCRSHGLPDQLIDVDVPGAVTFDVGSEIGLRFAEPAGVLVQAPS